MKNFLKRFFIILPLLFCIRLFASDAITIDSLFKKQIGLRSITNLSLLSTGNASSYNLYPSISVNGDPTIWNDTKQLSLNQTLIFSLLSRLDLLVSASGSFARKEYTNFITNAYSHENDISFNSLWLGFIYTGASFADFVPQISLQGSVISREKVIDDLKTFYVNSYSLQVSLRGYSDPVVFSFYAGFSYNLDRQFEFMKIRYGNSLFVGGDLSIVLSPKITLDLGAEQRFQSPQRINGAQNSELRSIPTFSLGSTYSINADTALSASASFGGSSASPDSIFGLSLWKKF